MAVQAMFSFGVLTVVGSDPGNGGKGYVLTSIQHSATDTSLLDQPSTEASNRLFVGNLTMNSEVSVSETGFGGGVVIASGDVDRATSGYEDCFVADSFGFGVEREMKESGEKGGTDDLLIGGHTEVIPGLPMTEALEEATMEDVPMFWVLTKNARPDVNPDTFDFQPELTSEPTAPEANLDSSAVATLVDLTGSSDMSPWTVTHATSSRDADGSAHAAISLGDGEAIEAAGGEYGIGEWGDAGGQTFEASDLFTFQLDLTTERTTSTGWAPSTTDFYVRVWNNDDGSIDGLAVDPSNPNTDVYAGDFLVERWQKSYGIVETDASLLI